LKTEVGEETLEGDLKIFVGGAANFFVQLASVPAEISTPYLKDEGEHVMYDFSAIIGVTGTRKGCVYFTAPREMVRELVTLLGEVDLADDICADFVGEIANTISGNAREHLGSGFMISVPVVLRGHVDDVRYPAGVPTFVIPILWKGYRSSLVVCLKEEIHAHSAAA